jgi:hypothetical protein
MTRRLIGVKVKDKEEEQKVREDRLQQLKDCRQYILVNNYGYYIYLPMVGGKRKTTRNLRTLGYGASLS